MPKGLPKAKYPGLYTLDDTMEATARGIQRTMENFQEEVISAYSGKRIKESKARYCLSLIGVSDDEIQDLIQSRRPPVGLFFDHARAGVLILSLKIF